MAVIPALRRLRQEDCKFQANLNSRVIPYLKTQVRTRARTHTHTKNFNISNFSVSISDFSGGLEMQVHLDVLDRLRT